MSNLVYSDRATRRGRGHIRPRRARTASGTEPTTRRVCVAVVAVEALYVLGLVIAVPIGRGVVALTFALAFVLATLVSARLYA